MTDDNGRLCYVSISDMDFYGYLQEINRQFFHPLGLSLQVQNRDEDDSKDAILKLRNYENECGVIYRTGAPSKAVADRLVEQSNKNYNTRKDVYGYFVQPLPGEKHYYLSLTPQVGTDIHEAAQLVIDARKKDKRIDSLLFNGARIYVDDSSTVEKIVAEYHKANECQNVCCRTTTNT